MKSNIKKLKKEIKDNKIFYTFVMTWFIILYLNNNYYLGFLCPADWNCK